MERVLASKETYGARYGGIVVWLLPELGAGNPAPFIVRFHASEEKGIAVVDIRRDELKKRFPIGGLKLRRCQPQARPAFEPAPTDSAAVRADPAAGSLEHLDQTGLTSALTPPDSGEVCDTAPDPWFTPTPLAAQRAVPRAAVAGRGIGLHIEVRIE